MGISHVSLGSSDIAKSQAFFDKTLEPVGFKLAREIPDGLLYAGDTGMILVRKPINGEAASFGNGFTLGLSAGSRAAVDAFHAAGLAAGGTCEGEPGLREHVSPTSYGAYVRDPDGNKICAFCHAPE